MPTESTITIDSADESKSAVYGSALNTTSDKIENFNINSLDNNSFLSHNINSSNNCYINL